MKIRTMILTVILGVVAVIGWVCCFVNGRRLKQWSDFCQHGRIFISYKGKVKLQAPLTEWVLWAKMLDKDQASKGRPVYQMGGTAVGVAKAAVPKRVGFWARVAARKTMPDRKPSDTKADPHTVSKGKYKATDETPKE